MNKLALKSLFGCIYIKIVVIMDNMIYKVIWEFYNKKTETSSDWRRAKAPNDKGVELFSDIQSAYDLFTEKMLSHGGDYAKVFVIMCGDKVIEDLSESYMFNGRVNGSHTFERDWSEYQRERSDRYVPDPTPYGSYKDEGGFYLKTSRQLPRNESINRFNDMRKIRMTEADLHNLVSGAVRRVVNEVFHPQQELRGMGLANLYDRKAFEAARADIEDEGMSVEHPDMPRRRPMRGYRDGRDVRNYEA